MIAIKFIVPSPFFINGRNKFVDVNEMAHNFKRNKFVWTTFAGNDMNRIQF